MGLLLYGVGLALTHYKIGQADRLSVYLAGVLMGVFIGALIASLPR